MASNEGAAKRKRTPSPEVTAAKRPAREDSEDEDFEVVDEVGDVDWIDELPEEIDNSDTSIHEEDQKPDDKNEDKKQTKSETKTADKVDECKPVEKKDEVKPVEKKVETKPVEKKGETKPVEKKGETKPVEKKVETKPVEKKVETKPVEKKCEIKPVEKKVETKPVEKKGETKPVEKKVETKPVEKKCEIKPVEKKVETKPVEKKVETKPVEKKVETKPVEKKQAEKKVEIKLGIKNDEKKDDENTPKEIKKDNLILDVKKLTASLTGLKIYHDYVERVRKDGLVCPVDDLKEELPKLSFNRCILYSGVKKSSGELCFCLERVQDMSESMKSLPNYTVGIRNVLKAFQDLVQNSGKPLYNPTTAEGFWRAVAVRSNYCGDIMLQVQVNAASRAESEETYKEVKEMLIEFFTNGPGKECKVTSLYVKIIFNKLLSVSHCAMGQQFIEDRILDLKLKLYPGSYFWICSDAATVLCKMLKSLYDEGNYTEVIDIGCGTGLFGQYLAKTCKGIQSVYGVDSVTTVKEAEANAQYNELKKCTYFVGTNKAALLNVVPKLPAKSNTLVIVNGQNMMSRPLMETLKLIRTVKRLVYLTLFSEKCLTNISILCQIAGKGTPYFPEKVIPVDLGLDRYRGIVVLRHSADKVPQELRQATAPMVTSTPKQVAATPKENVSTPNKNSTSVVKSPDVSAVSKSSEFNSATRGRELATEGVKTQRINPKLAVTKPKVPVNKQSETRVEAVKARSRAVAGRREVATRAVASRRKVATRDRLGRIIVRGRDERMRLMWSGIPTRTDDRRTLLSERRKTISGRLQEKDRKATDHKHYPEIRDSYRKNSGGIHERGGRILGSARRGHISGSTYTRNRHFIDGFDRRDSLRRRIDHSPGKKHGQQRNILLNEDGQIIIQHSRSPRDLRKFLERNRREAWASYSAKPDLRETSYPAKPDLRERLQQGGINEDNFVRARTPSPPRIAMQDMPDYRVADVRERGSQDFQDLRGFLQSNRSVESRHDGREEDLRNVLGRNRSPHYSGAVESRLAQEFQDVTPHYEREVRPHRSSSLGDRYKLHEADYMQQTERRGFEDPRGVNPQNINKYDAPMKDVRNRDRYREASEKEKDLRNIDRVYQETSTRGRDSGTIDKNLYESHLKGKSAEIVDKGYRDAPIRGRDSGNIDRGYRDAPIRERDLRNSDRGYREAPFRASDTRSADRGYHDAQFREKDLGIADKGYREPSLRERELGNAETLFREKDSGNADKRYREAAFRDRDSGNADRGYREAPFRARDTRSADRGYPVVPFKERDLGNTDRGYRDAPFRERDLGTDRGYLEVPFREGDSRNVNRGYREAPVREKDFRNIGRLSPVKEKLRSPEREIKKIPDRYANKDSRTLPERGERIDREREWDDKIDKRRTGGSWNRTVNLHREYSPRSDRNEKNMIVNFDKQFQKRDDLSRSHKEQDRFDYPREREASKELSKEYLDRDYKYAERRQSLELRDRNEEFYSRRADREHIDNRHKKSSIEDRFVVPGKSINDNDAYKLKEGSAIHKVGGRDSPRSSLESKHIEHSRYEIPPRHTELGHYERDLRHAEHNRYGTVSQRDEQKHAELGRFEPTKYLNVKHSQSSFDVPPPQQQNLRSSYKTEYLHPPGTEPESTFSARVQPLGRGSLPYLPGSDINLRESSRVGVAPPPPNIQNYNLNTRDLAFNRNVPPPNIHPGNKPLVTYPIGTRYPPSGTKPDDHSAMKVGGNAVTSANYYSRTYEPVNVGQRFPPSFGSNVARVPEAHNAKISPWITNIPTLQ